MAVGEAEPYAAGAAPWSHRPNWKPPRPNFHAVFFPRRSLEVLLDLEVRIRNKVAQAAATVGVEHEVIPGAATSDLVFAETREQIEKLRAENPELFETGGEPPGAQSGEAYRQELRKGTFSTNEPTRG